MRWEKCSLTLLISRVRPTTYQKISRFNRAHFSCKVGPSSFKAKHFFINSESDSGLELIKDEMSSHVMLQKFNSLNGVQDTQKKLIVQRQLLNLKLLENTDPSQFSATSDKLISDEKATGEVVSQKSKLAMPHARNKLTRARKFPLQRIILNWPGYTIK